MVLAGMMFVRAGFVFGLNDKIRPSVSAHVRWCEHAAPVRSCGTRGRLEREACGIPHLAKNERDVGHPAIADGIGPKNAGTEFSRRL